MTGVAGGSSVDAPAPRSRGVAFAVRAIVVLACVAIAALATWRVIEGREADLRQSRREATNLARSVAQHATDTLLTADSVALAVVARLQARTIEHADADELHTLLADEVRNLPALRRLSLIDAQGREWMSDRPTVDAKTDHAQQEYMRYHELIPDPSPHVGNPVLDARTNQWVIPVSRRYDRSDGGFGGVVLASIAVEYFIAYYERFAIGAHGVILMSGSDGTVYVSYPLPGRPVGSTITNWSLYADSILKVREGTTTLVSDFDHRERLYAHTTVPNQPLVVVTGLSIDEVLADWRDDAIAGAIVTAVAIAAIATIGFAFAAFVGRLHASEAALRESRARLQQANASLEGLAREDGLTGLANRREFDRVLNEEIERCRRNRSTLSLLLIDVDHFKRYNDRYGHVAGDDCLRRLASLIVDGLLRAVDFAARYGGEEFVVLLPQTDVAGALGVAERLRSRIRDARIEHADGDDGLASVSIGVAALVGASLTEIGLADDAARDEQAARAFVDRADDALYRAKRDGRNRVASAA